MKKLLFILLVFCACSKVQMDDCVTSAGKESQESRSLESFTSITTTDKLKVVLIQDTLEGEKVVIKGPKNLLAQITTQVENGRLYLNNTNTCNFVRSFEIEIVVEVYFKQLDRLEINAASEVCSLDTLSLNKLSILHNALSDIDLILNIENDVFVQSFNSAHTRLRGIAKSLKGSIEEISDLDARDLECEEVLLDQHSPIDCYIDGTKIIFVKIYNDGNIYYKREPSLYKDLNYKRGSGDLILL